MELEMFGKVTYLRGDCRLVGVTQNSISLLADSLEQTGNRSDKTPRIDCEQITEFDVSGLQILYTWLQCFRLRGVEPVIMNLPDKMQKAFHGLGFQGSV